MVFWYFEFKVDNWRVKTAFNCNKIHTTAMENLYWFRISKPLVNICFRSGVITFQRRAPIFRLQRYPARASRLWRHTLGTRTVSTVCTYPALCYIAYIAHSDSWKLSFSLLISCFSQALTNWSKVISLADCSSTIYLYKLIRFNNELFFIILT